MNRIVSWEALARSPRIGLAGFYAAGCEKRTFVHLAAHADLLLFDGFRALS